MGGQNSKKIAPETYYKFQRFYCLINSLQSHTEFIQAQEKHKQNPIKSLVQQIENLITNKKSSNFTIQKQNEIILSSLIKLRERLSQALNFSSFFSLLVEVIRSNDQAKEDALNLTTHGIKNSYDILRKKDLVQSALSKSMEDFIVSLSDMDYEWINGSGEFLNDLDEHEILVKFLLKVDIDFVNSLISSYWQDFHGLPPSNFFSITLDKYKKGDVIKTEKDKLFLLFEICRRAEGASNYEQLMELLKKFDFKFRLMSKIDKYEKIEAKIDRIIEINPQFEDLWNLHRIFRNQRIDIDPKGEKAEPYVLINCKNLEFSLSNLFYFSNFSKEISGLGEEDTLHKFDLQLDFGSCIKQSLQQMTNLTNIQLTNVQGAVPSDKIAAVSDKLDELKKKFEKFDEFLKEKIFSSINQVKAIQLKNVKKIAAKTHLVDKGVQAKAPNFKRLDLNSFYYLKQERKKELVKLYHSQLIKKKDRTFQTPLTNARMISKELIYERRIEHLEKLIEKLKSTLNQVKEKNESVKLQMVQIANNLDMLLIEARKLENRNKNVRNRAQEKIQKILVDVKKGMDQMERSTDFFKGLTETKSLANFNSNNQMVEREFFDEEEDDLQNEQAIQYNSNQFYQIHRFEGKEGYFRSHGRLGYGKNRKNISLVSSSTSICSKFDQKIRNIKKFTQGKTIIFSFNSSKTLFLVFFSLLNIF